MILRRWVSFPGGPASPDQARRDRRYREAPLGPGCVETAAAVATARHLEVLLEPSLIEVGYGRWTGRPFGQLTRTALWKQIQSSPSAIRFPEGETLTEVQRRGVEALDAIAKRHPNGVVAAVSHADVIRLALAHYLGVHIDLFQRIIVSPVSVSAVALGDRVPRILRMNDTGTLGDLATRAGRRRPTTKGRPSRGRGS
jgi:broad specificity phosphatase PhoE